MKLRQILKNLLVLVLTLSFFSPGMNVQAEEQSAEFENTVNKSNLIYSDGWWPATQYGGTLEGMFDGNADTFTWWAMPGDTYQVDDYIGVDLGEVKQLGRFKLVMGSTDKAKDHFRRYKICYSDDKTNWMTVKEVQQDDDPEVVTELNFSENGIIHARYVAVIALDSANNWIIIKEMQLEATDIPEAIDKTALQSRYDELKDTENKNYTEASFAKFEAALAAALVILNTDDTALKQTQVVAALEELNNAFSGLTVQPDTSEFPKPTHLAKVDSNIEYRIYPQVQQIIYSRQAFAIDSSVNLVMGAGLDVYTKDKAKQVLAEKGIAFVERAAYMQDQTNVLVGVHGSDDVADRYFKAIVLADDHFTEHDAYQLSIKDNTIAVLGKDTDAAFYGLVSLQHIFKQINDSQIREMLINDFANQQIRGVIEGYYGFPWGYQKRLDLMEFSARFKNNIFIYAPKDDPLHRSQWRSTYKNYQGGGSFNPVEKLDEFAKLAEYGNKNKNRYVYTIAPFHNQRLTYADKQDRGGQVRYWPVIDRLEELYAVGIRQFGILADDIDKNTYNPDLAVDLMHDLSKWAEEKQDVYDFIFVPFNYPQADYGWFYLAGELDKYEKGFPKNVQIVITGTDVGGRITQHAIDKFIHGGSGRRKPVIWLNWPVNDVDKGHASDESKNFLKLHMGKGEMMDQGVKNLNGTFTNPMQEAYASLVSIFAVDDYAWNTDSFNADKSWHDGFSYIDSTASAELQEIASHMSNMAWGQMSNLEESANLLRPISDFEVAMQGNDKTVIHEKGQQLINEYQKILDAVDHFRAKTEFIKLKDEINPYLNNLRDKAESAIKYIQVIVMAVEGDAKDKISAVHHEANSLYDRKNTYTVTTIGGNNETRHAESGMKVIQPNLDALKEKATAMVNNLPITPEEKEALRQIIDEAEKITDLENKTHQSLQAFKAALKKANEVYKSATAGSADVQTAIKNLRKAIDGLKDNPIINSFDDVSVDNIVQIPDRWHPYQAAYGYGNLIDGKDETFTWFAPNKGNDTNQGDMIGLDLFAVKRLGKFRLVMGNGTTGDDYMSEYRIRYSDDGVTWKTYGAEKITQDTSSKITELDFEEENIKARYVVVESLKFKPNWLKISEMKVEILPEAVEKFTVHFNVDGGTAIADQQIAKGEKVSRPSVDPQKENHTFAGWYSDKDFNTEFDFAATLITKETTIYAKWKKNEVPPQEIELKDTVSGISAKFMQSSFPVDVQMKIEIVERKQEGKDIEAYDISFTDAAGNKVQPTDEISIAIPLKGKGTANLFLMHETNDGDEVIPYVVQGDYIAFKARNFSVYKLVRNRANATVPKPKTPTASTNKTTVKTADQGTPAVLFIVSTMIALVSGWMFIRQRKLG